ncbi:transient receptor potential cation channel subfamily M member-like 2 [Amphiura filiformis]|uniref:transient receptor potential cation channel subfamily M member-like 2 n=1 Tax=Amphiura filiformis TaxID=82378 RepID=UPI003B2170BF
MDGTGSLPRKHQSLHFTYLYPERKSQYFDLAALEHRRSTSWIQNNIKRRECIRFVPNAEDHEFQTCECGEIKSRHAQLRHTDEDGDTEETWTIHKDTRRLATNAFGEIEFVGPGSGFAQKPRKFIRCDYKTDPKLLLTLLSTEWKLGAPKLLLSVMGGNKNFKLSGRLKEVFCRGILDAAVSTGAWIISAGTHSGVMKYVGEAVRDYQMVRRYEDVVAIGIITWGTLKQQRQLIDDRGKYPAHLSTRKHNDKNGVFLDPNHTHFILVDDGTKGKFGAGLSLRVKLEEMISTHVKVGTESSTTHVPVVCVILEGGPSTLRKAHAAITHGTPIVVVADSGRIADVLSLAIKQSKDNGEHRIMDATLKAKVAQMLRKICVKVTEDSQVMLQQVEDCLKAPHLLNVYEETSGIPMDVAVLNALMRGNHRKQQDFLRLAQAWNRIDVARTDLLDASSKDFDEMKEDEVHDLLRDALVHNRVDFIKLYLESGVNLKAYLTHAELTYLYNQVKRGTVLYSLLAKVSPKPKGKPRWFSLADVGRVIQGLTMDRYKAPYQDLEGHHKERRNTKDMSQEIPDMSEIKSPRFKNPVRELFLYAVLNTFEEMAHFLWEEGKETMAAALTASKIYKNMAVRLSVRDAELKMQLKGLSKKYSKLAIAVLNECNKDDEQWSSILLLRDLPHWGHVNCISLAGRNLHFLNHAGVQDLVKEIWYGELSSEGNSSLVLWICTLIPPLIPMLVSFRPDKGSIIQPHQHAISSAKRHSNAGYIEDHMEMQAKGTQDDNWDVRRTRTTSTIPLQSDTGESRRNELALWQMMMYFYNSPMIIFRHNVVSHLLFLGLFSYIMLSNNFKSTEPPWYEYLLMVWVATFLAEEFRQIAHGDAQKWRLRFKEWFSDYWNQLDFATLLLFGIGTAMRFNAGLLNAARVVLAFDLFIFYMRLLNSFTIYQHLGPKLIMIGKMFLDVSFFVCILFVFLIAYGITLQAILYPTITDIQGLIYGVLYRPYFQIYGELFLDEIRGTPGDGTCTTNQTLINEALPICPEYSGIGVFLLAIYMIFSNVLLLNLLIAMFR